MRRLPVWQDDEKTLEGQDNLTTNSGEVVLVDQLESTSPGFIAQLKGTLTQQRYKYATIFVDQFSQYNFVYLQKRVTSQESVMAKHAFERSAEQRGIEIKHYHADNGCFVDNTFILDCQANRHSGALYKGPTGTNTNLHALRHEQVAEDGSD